VGCKAYIRVHLALCLNEEESTIREIERATTIIALFNQMKMYEIKDHKECVWSVLNATMEQECIPPNAKFLVNATIGGSLWIEVWKFNRHGVDLNMIVNPINCIPVSDSFVRDKDKNIIDVGNFWDITMGISNPSVFTPPTGCKEKKLDEAGIHPFVKKYIQV